MGVDFVQEEGGHDHLHLGGGGLGNQNPSSLLFLRCAGKVMISVYVFANLFVGVCEKIYITPKPRFGAFFEARQNSPGRVNPVVQRPFPPPCRLIPWLGSNLFPAMDPPNGFTTADFFGASWQKGLKGPVRRVLVVSPLHVVLRTQIRMFL